MGLVSLKVPRYLEVKMARVISGTKQRKQQVKVIKATGGNVTKIRCPHCQHTLAHPKNDGNGGTVHQCASCGSRFSFVSM
jgi:transcription elongation factor Elf1